MKKPGQMRHTTITQNTSIQNYHEFGDKVKENAYVDSQPYFLIYINYDWTRFSLQVIKWSVNSLNEFFVHLVFVCLIKAFHK